MTKEKTEFGINNDLSVGLYIVRPVDFLPSCSPFVKGFPVWTLLARRTAVGLMVCKTG